MNGAIPHPSWCSQQDCKVWRYDEHPTEVVHWLTLLHERVAGAAASTYRGIRQVDIREVMILDPTERTVVRTSGPRIGLMGEVEDTDPATAARIAEAMQRAVMILTGPTVGPVDRRWTARRRLDVARRDLVRVVAALETDDAAGRPSGELLARWQTATDQITASAGHDGGSSGPARSSPARLQLALRAVEVLTTGRALAERVLAGRWRAALVALRSGADVLAVARAVGLTEDEVTAGLWWWASGESTGSDATDAEHVEVAEMLGRPDVKDER